MLAFATVATNSTGAGRISGQTTEVRFVVLVPDTSQKPQPEIYCAISLDGWPQEGRKLTQTAPGIYSASWTMRVGQTIEYKFLREPTWDAVEKNADGSEIANRSLTIRGDVVEQVVLHAVARWADREQVPNRHVEFNEPGGKRGQRQSTLTGDIRFHEKFKSPQLENERTIIVYLPPGYDKQRSQRYPVLYMHDGNNLFDAATSFSGVEWGMDETAQRLIESKEIRPLIIVGIYNTPARVEEYTPTPDAKRGGGRGRQYLNFISETLKPFIDKTYRTHPDRENTAIGGSSLGGLISLYALTTHADVFGSAAAISPSLWWSDGVVLQKVRDAKFAKPLKLWFDIEVPHGYVASAALNLTGDAATSHELVKILEGKRLQTPRDYHFEPVPGGHHHERDWAARVDKILRYLFPPDIES